MRKRRRSEVAPIAETGGDAPLQRAALKSYVPFRRPTHMIKTQEKSGAAAIVLYPLIRVSLRRSVDRGGNRRAEFTLQYAGLSGWLVRRSGIAFAEDYPPSGPGTAVAA